MRLAPVILFCYNRAELTKQTLHALSQCKLADQSKLFIFCDGPGKQATTEQLQSIQHVREIVKSDKWCADVEVFESSENKGLANSVIEGVSRIINDYGKVIVLEDDIIVSKHFLEYMNAALQKYEPEENVFQVSGYTFPIEALKTKCDAFFFPHISSWGWGTWKRAWNQFDTEAKGYEKLKNDAELKKRFDFNGTRNFSEMLFQQMEKHTIDSWAIRWKWTVFQRGGITLYPSQTFVLHAGEGANATHVKKMIMDGSVLNDDFSVKSFPEDTTINSEIVAIITEYFEKTFGHKQESKNEKTMKITERIKRRFFGRK